jgi:hypothetical protein
MDEEMRSRNETADLVGPGKEALRRWREISKGESGEWIADQGLTDGEGRLSDDGRALARLLASRESKPRYDSINRTLWWRGRVVKQLEREAANQEEVLLAFEEAGWPPRIDDPLPREVERDPKLRLRETVRSLNDKRKWRGIRFRASNGGVRWEENEDSEKNA